MEMIEATVSRIASDVTTAQDKREFDAFDNKGRRFGACATKSTLVFEDAVTTLWNFPSNLKSANENRRKAGTYYAFRPHGMRGGKFYGASQGTNIFDTEAKRDAAVAKYFADAEKRAMKNKARADA